jgi:hypothetical protein
MRSDRSGRDPGAGLAPGSGRAGRLASRIVWTALVSTPSALAIAAAWSPRAGRVSRSGRAASTATLSLASLTPSSEATAERSW